MCGIEATMLTSLSVLIRPSTTSECFRVHGPLTRYLRAFLLDADNLAYY